MKKQNTFGVITKVILIISVVFMSAIFGSTIGYGNRLVMLWMVVGPLLYWILVLMLGVLTLKEWRQTTATSISNMLYLSIAFVLYTFLIMGWSDQENYMYMALAVILAISIGLLGALRHYKAEIGMVVIALTALAWFVEVSVILVFTATLALSYASANYFKEFSSS